MTDKELRRLSKENLLQIMIDQQRRIESLERTLAEKENALEELRKQVAGADVVQSVADKLTQLVNETQTSAKSYLEDLRNLVDDMDDRLYAAGGGSVSSRRRRPGRRADENE